LRLKWGVKAAEGDKSGSVFELYAIKSSERDGKAPLEGNVVTDAKDEFDQNGQQVVGMSMNSDGSRRWAQLTKANIGHCIAIVLDGFVYSAPNVNSEITGGRSSISGHFTPEEAKDLANVLKSGKMPARAHIVQEDVIGPSLGQESINASIISFGIAIILLMAYMCLLYGFIPGMVANSALLINLFFTLGILASFQAALTLSGIAGMVLTLGCAVDANVLIYERTKEELRLGKNVKESIKEGYQNAFSAIFDSNVTSLITGIILFNFGTGPILGFATTYIIGLIISFFTAVFMTRLVYEHFLKKDKWLNLKFTTPTFFGHLFVDPHYNIIGHLKKEYAVVLAIVLVCFISIGVRHLSLSIDFTGGRNYVVQFDKPTSPEKVRSLIGENFGKESSVNVLAIGTNGKTVRISTNYRVEDNSNTVEQDIEGRLYKSVKPLLFANVTEQAFTDRGNLAGGSIVSSTKVGPSVASDITRGAVIAIILSLIGIGIYILIRFKNISYSIGSVVALSFDTLIVVGAFSMFWGILPFSLEIDQTFIAAILTVIGYSINDKVVIFDRVREYFHRYKDEDRHQLFNDSLNTTLGRTVNTSVCVLIVLICIFIFGAETIRSFAFAMILGVVFGTLSSLFLAAPIAYNIQEWQAKRKAGKQ
jgi:SecD/SecF fusion protein